MGASAGSLRRRSERSSPRENGYQRIKQTVSMLIFGGVLRNTSHRRSRGQGGGVPVAERG
jgi:hypothetical protein